MSCRRGFRLRSVAVLVLGAAALHVPGPSAVAMPLGTASASGAEKPARLGVYYFGGWSGSLSNFHFAGLLEGPYTGRQPLYGWLDNTPRTMRTQLGSGSVTVNGSTCPRPCVRRFDEGLVAVLRAQPARGYRFVGWSGACTARKPTCALLMDRAQSAVARFARL